MTETVIFIGGPHDLSRQALPSPLEKTYVALTWKRRNPFVGSMPENANYAPVDVVKSTYRLTPFSNPNPSNGQTGYAYIWNNDESGDLVDQATSDTIARLRGDNTTLFADLRAVKTRLATRDSDVEYFAQKFDEATVKITALEGTIGFLRSDKSAILATLLKAEAEVEILKTAFEKHTKCARGRVLSWAKCALSHATSYSSIRTDLNLIIDECSR